LGTSPRSPIAESFVRDESRSSDEGLHFICRKIEDYLSVYRITDLIVDAQNESQGRRPLWGLYRINPKNFVTTIPIPSSYLRDVILLQRIPFDWGFSIMSTSKSMIPHTFLRRVSADGVSVFYREAGPADGPVVLLLHGFPTSSFQFKELILRLGDKYRVIAPDLPGFGFTEVPVERKYTYTFDSLAKTIEAFTDALNLKRYALYIFDFGAPTGLRLALSRPERVSAIVSQNGNAYEEGMGEPWAPLKKWWKEETTENRDVIRGFLGADGIRFQYFTGMPDPSKVSPESYTLDIALVERPGNIDIQLDLHFDYRNNVTIYPKFHEYFRSYQPPFLAVWGKNDPFFIPAGAEAFKKDIPKATIQYVDAGHFALETHVEEIADAMREFFESAKI
jgi:pimeloyl-ACP methyl ester carboxylesterase